MEPSLWMNVPRVYCLPLVSSLVACPGLDLLYVRPSQVLRRPTIQTGSKHLNIPAAIEIVSEY
jgi:hypothetical protein